jgi:transcription elongation factor Elf1
MTKCPKCNKETSYVNTNDGKLTYWCRGCEIRFQSSDNVAAGPLGAGWYSGYKNEVES